MKKKYFSFLITIFISISIINAQNLTKEAGSKIKSLEKLIKKAEGKKINVLKEKTTIRTAEIFLKNADWDEKNIDINENSFKKVSLYKKEARKMAQELPDFERKDINLMLDKAIKNLNLVLSGKATRQESPHVKWEKITHNGGDQLTYKNRPVFLAHYSWKPKTKELQEYHGNQDGFFLTPGYVREDGSVNPKILNNLDNKPNGNLGFIFMNHKNVPKWTSKVYGENFNMRKDTYTAYDIDHPGARELQSNLLKAVVPKMANKKYSQLGYMLVNEPHFFVYKDKRKKKKPWATGPVSNYTIDKFKKWLEEKHKTISVLNNIWGTNFKNFKTMSIDSPLDISLHGTPIWYDWTAFNMDRVTDWYGFLKEEIRKYDPKAKVHLKIMPNLWSENKRSHGIDLEALTNLSGIVGNDSGAEHNRLWGKPAEWEEKYKFDWRELCMAFDFMKSVSPNKINFNSELHYLSTVRSRDLYLDPNYVRASFWLAHTYGMTASQIWYWPRKADGSISKKAINDKGYAGSNNQQPRVTNEVAMTLIDLNANAEEIMSMQRQRRPIRIFYSKTSAINNKKHMDHLFELYEALHFEGTPLGFVTNGIFNTQDHKNWDTVLVYDTPNVTEEELQTLQQYLHKGGTIILDSKSLLKNEYGKEIGTLKASKGKIIRLNTITEIKEKSLALLAEKNHLSEIKITETNSMGSKGCIWKVVKNKTGNHVLSVVNVGKTDATLDITLKGSNAIVCKNIIDGTLANTKPILKPNDVLFVEVTAK